MEDYHHHHQHHYHCSRRRKNLKLASHQVGTSWVFRSGSSFCFVFLRFQCWKFSSLIEYQFCLRQFSLFFSSFSRLFLLFFIIRNFANVSSPHCSSFSPCSCFSASSLSLNFFVFLLVFATFFVLLVWFFSSFFLSLSHSLFHGNTNSSSSSSSRN